MSEPNEVQLPWSNGQEWTEQHHYEILNENYPNYDLSFKVIIIGNSGKYLISNYK